VYDHQDEKSTRPSHLAYHKSPSITYAVDPLDAIEMINDIEAEKKQIKA
jgi:hypothetical protein